MNEWTRIIAIVIRVFWISVSCYMYIAYLKYYNLIAVNKITLLVSLQKKIYVIGAASVLRLS